MRGLAAIVWWCALLPAQVVGGRVTAAANAPVDGTTLRLRWRMAPELPGLCGRALGDEGLGELLVPAAADGTFRLQLPHRGPFELVAERGALRSLPCFPVLAGDFVDLALEPRFQVAGQLVTADATPAAAVPVMLVPHETSWARLAGYRMPEARAATVTDAEGRFALDLPLGYLRTDRWHPFHTLATTSPGFAPPRNLVLRPTAANRALRVVLQAAPAPAVVTVPHQVQARLRRGGAALVGAPVLWSRLQPRVPPVETTATTDADGRTTVAVAAGETVLGFVQVDGTWLPFARRVAAAAIDLGEVEVVARALQGTLRDAAGQPLAGARILVAPVAPLADEPPQVVWTDRAGRFLLPAVPTGALDVWAEAGAAGFACRQLDALAEDATLAVTATGAVTGTVLDPEGAPVAGAWVLLLAVGKPVLPGSDRRPNFLASRTGPDGTVHFAGLPDGRWQVVAHRLFDERLFAANAGADTGTTFTVKLARALE